MAKGSFWSSRHPLRYVSKRLQGDKDVAGEVVWFSWEALKWVGEELRNDPDVVEPAFEGGADL